MRMRKVLRSVHRHYEKVAELLHVPDGYRPLPHTHTLDRRFRRRFPVVDECCLGFHHSARLSRRPMGGHCLV